METLVTAAELAGWLTLSNAAARLGVPRNRVRKLERAGVLHPRRDFSGKRRYSPAELDATKARSERPRSITPARPRPAVDGSVAARAFRMFGADRSLRDVVLELELRPDDAADLRRQYAEFGADLLVGAEELEQLRELLDWNGTTARSLVAAVNGRLRRQYQRGREEGLKSATEADTHSEERIPVNGKRPEKAITGS